MRSAELEKKAVFVYGISPRRHARPKNMAIPSATTIRPPPPPPARSSRPIGRGKARSGKSMGQVAEVVVVVVAAVVVGKPPPARGCLRRWEVDP